MAYQGCAAQSGRIHQGANEARGLFDSLRGLTAASAMAGQIDGQDVPAVIGHIAALQCPDAVIAEHAVNENGRWLGRIEGLATGVGVDGSVVDF